MKNFKAIAMFVAILLCVAAGGYWLGNRSNPESGISKQHTGASPARKVLYYRNPMGLPDTSPIPKKDAMGMDYVAVFEGEEKQQDGVVSFSVDKVQKLGVKSEPVTFRQLDKTLRVTGLISVDERHSYAIASKFEGWVEKLYVNTTGQTVSKGQVLFDVYSPELVSVQREYAIAAQGENLLKNADAGASSSMKQLADASLVRLKNLDISDSEIKRLTNGKPARNLSFYSPVFGVVLEKKAVQGMRFMPGEVLYQIADLATVWVLAEVSEQDIAQLKLGSLAQVKIAAYPDKHFEGKVTFIYPTLNPLTRTVQVRLEIANTQGLLKPAMFANVSLPAGSSAPVLTVPDSAVIDSGTRQWVLVQQSEGRYAPREVKLGKRGNDYIEVLNGLAEGEQVVTSALFLIDAESNLKAALAGFGVPAAHEGSNKSAATVGHQAQGILEKINADGSVSITHEAIKSLGWPGMTMDFALANAALVAGIKPGSAISFELVERNPDEWVITRLQALAQQHKGH